MENKTIECRICGAQSDKVFDARIMSIHNISYYHCSNCGFLQTEKPYWLGEAYSESINCSDTGLVRRNLLFSGVTAVILYLFFGKKGTFLDYAGGYGLFVRLMRDIGFDFYWDDQYTPNLIAKGFEYKPGMPVDLVTMYEVFEHFADPITEIEKVMKISKNMLFTTELLPEVLPRPEEWWYFGLDHGQHIAFYSRKTLEFIAKKYGLNFYTNGKMHLITTKKINPVLYKFFATIPGGITASIMKLLLRSKTWDDNLKMKNKKAETSA